jgi:hypothetical protein
MVSIDDLQKPSTGMSKIIVAVAIGLFSLLILNIFNLLSFWTLVAVLVGVAMVLKFGVPSVGTVTTLVLTVVVIAVVVSAVWWLWNSGYDYGIFQKKGLQGWEGTGSFKYDYFYLSPGDSLTKKVEMDGVNVKLFGIETESPSSPSSKSDLVVKIEDLDGHKRSATFRFLVEGDKITFSELSLPYCGGVVAEKLFDAAPAVNNEDIWNYAKAAMRGRIASYAIGKDGRIKTYSISLDGSLQRSENIVYRVTILNKGPSPLKVRDIKVESG